MGPAGAFEILGGPEFGGASEFDEGPDPEEMGPDESEAGEGPDGPPDQAMGGGGPEFGGWPGAAGWPGFGNGPAGQFGPRPGPHSFGSMAPPPGDALQAVLGLNDQQVQSLRQFQREKSRKLDESQFQIRQKQDTLIDLLEQEEPDGSALVSAVKSLHALRKQAREIEKEFQAKTAAVLTDEQKTRLKSIQDRRRIPQARQEAARFGLLQPREDAPGEAVPQE
jgi:Spy/CpxP family protein refolding chaperone